MFSEDGTASVEESYGDEDPIEDPRVLLFMQSGRDRELLVETLDTRYRTETTTDVAAFDSSFDCCIFDAHEFNRVAGTVQDRRATDRPVFLPFVLLLGESETSQFDDVWEYVDDVIELPVEKRALHSRIGNLIDRRRTAAQLAKRESELADTIEDLRLKERAMDEAPVGITIAELDGADTPLIYANDGFEALTGYSSNVLGRDCRFLQGEDTDSSSISAIRSAIDDREPVSVDILNYRKDGGRFWNGLNIAPLPQEGQEARKFVGFQTDITERKIRERRMEVLNRVLSHNLRNKMNVIQGYAALLQEGSVENDSSRELTEIQAAAEELLGLADDVRDIEQVLDAPELREHIDLSSQVEQLVNTFRNRFPSVQFDCSIPGGPTEVSIPGLESAIEEAIENAIKHNDSPTPAVEISIQRPTSDWLEIEIRDDGPGIPAEEIDVLKQGETPVRHADRLGLWLMYWIVTKAGGTFAVRETDDGWTTVCFSIPLAELDSPS